MISTALGAFGTPLPSADAAGLINPNGGSADIIDFSDGTLNGGFTSSLITTGTTPVVPLPSAAWMALVTLGGLAALGAIRRAVIG